MSSMRIMNLHKDPYLASKLMILILIPYGNRCFDWDRLHHFSLFGGIFVILTGIFTFLDAWTAGIYNKKKGVKFFLTRERGARMTVGTKIFSYLLASLLITGCASTSKTPFRAHPRLDEKLKATKKVLVMPPRIDVYQITAGGVKEKIDEWTTEARKNVMAAIREQLKSKSRCIFQDLSKNSLSTEVELNLQDTQALFDAVNVSIIAHTYGAAEQLFSEKIKDFDYSLGPEIKVLGEQADALLFVRAVDNISTGGRKALQASTVIMLALLGVVVVPQGGTAAISIALVDCNTGSILWYNFKGSSGAHDLRDPTSAAGLVKELLKDFPSL